MRIMPFLIKRNIDTLIRIITIKHSICGFADYVIYLNDVIDAYKTPNKPKG